MEILNKIHSKIDNSIKYIFLSDDNLAIEATYINKNDGKDIICLPSQTSCSMGCKFCHITDITDKIKLRNINSHEIYDMVDLIYIDLKLDSKLKTLLISFMGCGEPLFNNRNLINAMYYLKCYYDNIRFALATSMPCSGNFFKYMIYVPFYKLNLKIHLSLHYTDDVLRKEWMPNSLNIQDSIEKLYEYKMETGNNVEIHYALINRVNDTDDDIKRLIELLNGKDIPIKFLFYNEKESLDYHKSTDDRVSFIRERLESNGIKTEYYIPPALDIGGSCGQILKEYYLKYNTKII